jgi:hypothetical protein
MGLSLSAYVRQVVLSRPLPPRRAVRPIPEVNREGYASLAHALANLNQLAGGWTSEALTSRRRRSWWPS